MDWRPDHRRLQCALSIAFHKGRDLGMSPTDKPDKEDDSSKFPDDLRPAWAEEDREIEG
jgi:hypothetical protein